MNRDFKTPSIYTSIEDLEAMANACGGLCRDGYDSLLLLGVPGPREVITSSKPKGAPTSHYFHLYDTLFVDLGFKLPFSNFVCETLCVVNIAPTQLHPNSWGFLRCFEILCDRLGITPSYELFFCFYWVKGVPSVAANLMSFSSYTNLARFYPFKNNYHKQFHGRWFKVFDNPDFAQLTTYEDCSYKFPFYWTETPQTAIKIVDGMLTPDQVHAAEFLETIPVLRCSLMIKAAAENQLDEYLTSGEFSFPCFLLFVYSFTAFLIIVFCFVLQLVAPPSHLKPWTPFESANAP